MYQQMKLKEETLELAERDCENRIWILLHRRDDGVHDGNGVIFKLLPFRTQRPHQGHNINLRIIGDADKIYEAQESEC